MTKTKSRSRRSSPAQRRERPTILVVDDEKMMREVVKFLLERDFDAKIVEAESNEQALRAAKRRKFDLVISDYGRAGGNGLSSCASSSCDTRRHR